MYVHWHDGLFLQPHHLQKLQNAVFDGIFGERKLSMSFSYGVVKAQLSADKLKSGHVLFDALEVALPSGIVFRFPDEALLPSLDIRAELPKHPNGLEVGLALPRLRESGENSIPAGEKRSGVDNRLRYQAIEVEVADENSGTNKQLVQLLMLNGRLAFGHNEFVDEEYFPLVKILHSADEVTDAPRMADPRFVPATLILRGSEALYRLVRDLSTCACFKERKWSKWPVCVVLRVAARS